MHLDFTDLRLFAAVADAGSITAGAERAALSLAAASARIRALEQQAGATLLQRGRRGVTLTAAGAALLRHARQLLRQAEAMRAELGDHAGANQATVRLLANTAALYEWLPELLAEFLVAHPRIDLALRERGSTAAADAVREDRADLAVVADHADLAGLQARAFRQEVDRLFDDVDVLLCPTSSLTAPPHVDDDTIIQIFADDHRNVIRLTRLTSYWDLAATPAISLPWGFDGQGLPHAVQLVTRVGTDEALLSIAARLEVEAPDRGRRPPLE